LSKSAALTPNPYISAATPDARVISVKVPFLLLRYSASAERAVFGRPGHVVDCTRTMSCQPSPSTSTNAQPDPIVSGRYFFPNAPFSCLKRIPAAAVTSVNFSVAGAATGGCAASIRIDRRNAISARIIV
jgi:hypothetical protein